MKQLPNVTFCEHDAAEIEREILGTYEKIAGVTLYPGNPVRLFLESLAFVIARQRFSIDWAAKQNLLAFATGEYLDHLGILTDTVRMKAKRARAIMRFARTEGSTGGVLIPAGTRVSPDGKVFFRTLMETEIRQSEAFVDAEAERLEVGSAGNGLLPGQIDKLVDPVVGVAGAANITTSLGGADIEDDDNFRERIRLSVGAFAAAGPSESYVYWAKSAHQDIADVCVTSPSPGIVEIRPLLRGGVLPSPEILDRVRSVLDPDTVIPLTDDVRVVSPGQVSSNIRLTYYVDRDRAAGASFITDAVDKAVQDFVAWQCGALGRISTLMCW